MAVVAKKAEARMMNLNEPRKERTQEGVRNEPAASKQKQTDRKYQ